MSAINPDQLPKEDAPDKAPLTDRECILRSRLRSMYMAAAILIASIIGMTYAFVHYGPQYRQMMVDSKDRSGRIEQLTSELEEAAKVQIDLQRCLEETKNPAKRRAKDMEIYISKRYPGVAKELANIISVTTDRLCHEHDVPFALIVGLMETESQFNPFAKSHADALGLMQVIPKYWAEPLGIKEARELHGIEKGIYAGIYVLKHYIEENNGNVTKALQNYNGTKRDEYHTKVYKNVGRFTVFRSNEYLDRSLEVKAKGEPLNLATKE